MYSLQTVVCAISRGMARAALEQGTSSPRPPERVRLTKISPISPSAYCYRRAYLEATPQLAESSHGNVSSCAPPSAVVRRNLAATRFPRNLASASASGGKRALAGKSAGDLTCVPSRSKSSRCRSTYVQKSH